jgi:hypothetical protein
MAIPDIGVILIFAKPVISGMYQRKHPPSKISYTSSDIKTLTKPVFLDIKGT